ncbi:MAG: ATP-binding cassette domain-containing protein [Patescibacteria group bacterium]|nr:ATP-binding cassette domain-containing protein [Patescibacteria group bacterium]
MARIPVIKTVNLTKSFNLGKQEVTALAGVNVEIYSGEFIAFFGPSGCGKSTLMSMIAGLQAPTSGKIYIRGEGLADLDKDDLAKHRRSKIGMIFQSFNLIPTMDVVENIALPLSFGGIGKKQRIQRAINLLETVGMSKFKDHTPVELSGGQQQRIAIARSLVTNPWIILADEPTGNLDSKSANDVMRLLISLNKKSKRTIVLITHNPDYLEYVDRIFYLRDGKVIKIKVNPKAKDTSLDDMDKNLSDHQDPTDVDYEEIAKNEVDKIAKGGNESENISEEELNKDEKQTEKEEPMKKEIPAEGESTAEEKEEPGLPDLDTEKLEEVEEEKPEKKTKVTKLKPIKLGGRKK